VWGGVGGGVVVLHSMDSRGDVPSREGSSGHFIWTERPEAPRGELCVEAQQVKLSTPGITSSGEVKKTLLFRSTSRVAERKFDEAGVSKTPLS